MFSPYAHECTKCVDSIFITGVFYENIKNFISNSNASFTFKPEILFSFPENKELITYSVLDFVFPGGITPSYSEELPKLYSIILTNEKGVRSYIYILKVYEKININEILSEKEKDSINSNNHCYMVHSTQINMNDNYLNLNNFELDDNYLKKPLINSALNNSFRNLNCQNIDDIIIDHNKNIYFPYAICVWSKVAAFEEFRKILLEFNSIIHFSSAKFGYLNGFEGALHNFRNCEMIHLIIFLNNILKPPNNSKLMLNLHFNRIDFITPSKFEIPYSDHNIKILIDSLECTAIIKLWCSILSEKHIIVIANQNMLLFSICEGLMNLIFPFKWLHTYIPILPREQIDYLDSPTPYVMGVLSSYVDYEYLRENYPNHIICDVNTSMIYGTPACILPSMEEINLRKKIQFIKKPELYEMEDLRDENSHAGDIFNIEDINPMKSISENIQNVFFRIFHKTLKNIEYLYIKNNVFDSKSFLDDIFDEETKDFWEKIINTVSFEFFILSFQYLDDSNTKIFKNMLKLENDEKNYFSKNQNSSYIYSMNLQNNINFLFKELENKANIYSNKFLTGASNINRSPQLFENLENINFLTENDINYISPFFSFEKYSEKLNKLKFDYNLIIEKIHQHTKKLYMDENQKFSITNNNNQGENSKKNSNRTINMMINRGFQNIKSSTGRADIFNNPINKIKKRNNFSYDFSRNFTSLNQYGAIEESNMELRPSHLQQSEKNLNANDTTSGNNTNISTRTNCENCPEYLTDNSRNKHFSSENTNNILNFNSFAKDLHYKLRNVQTEDLKNNQNRNPISITENYQNFDFSPNNNRFYGNDISAIDKNNNETSKMCQIVQKFTSKLSNNSPKKYQIDTENSNFYNNTEENDKISFGGNKNNKIRLENKIFKNKQHSNTENSSKNDIQCNESNPDESQKCPPAYRGSNYNFKENINFNRKKRFRLYGENGFLQFVVFLFEILNTKELSELGYKQLILTEIKKHSSIINKIHKKMNFNFDFNKIQEIEKEDESEISIECNSPRIPRNGRDVDNSYLIFDNIYSNYGLVSSNLNNTNVVYNGNFINTNKNNKIIDIQFEKLPQYYLLIASYMDDFEETHLDILSLYLHSADLDKTNFPRYLFFCYLDNFNVQQMKLLLNKTNNKLVKKIVNYKITKFLKNKNFKTDIKSVLNQQKLSPTSDKSQNPSEVSDKKFDISNNKNSQNHHLCKKDPIGKSTIINQNLMNKLNINNENITMKNSQITDANNFFFKSDENNFGTDTDNDDRDSPEINLKRRGTYSKSNNIIQNVNIKGSFIQRSSNAYDIDNRRPSFLDENFTHKYDGVKFIENMKNNDNKDKVVKLNLINYYKSVYKTNKDPISLAEDISVKLFSLILTNALNKYKSDMISVKLLNEICLSNEFKEIKDLVAELQKINLSKLKTFEMKLCFWLNIYNFLTVFSVIIKKEVLSNYYEWYRFLKNSCFDIGGFEVSLYEIENCILTNSLASQNIYGEIPIFKDDDKRKSLVMENIDKLTYYAISLPTKSSPGLRIYFPNNLHQLIRLNAIEYLSKNITLDFDKNILNISEYVTWIDQYFFHNLNEYQEFLSEEFVEFLKNNIDDIQQNIVKYGWCLNFSNIN